MILYHGSNVKIEKIDLAKSKVGKDFGCGFYLTTNYDHALRQAQRKVEQYSFGEAIVNKFSFDENILNGNELSVKTFCGYSSEWADFVLLNRQNRTHKMLHNYDIVIGPVANDTVGYQIRRYISNIITKEQFIEEIKYMKESSIQYFFGTEKAINQLKIV